MWTCELTAAHFRLTWWTDTWKTNRRLIRTTPRSQFETSARPMKKSSIMSESDPFRQQTTSSTRWSMRIDALCVEVSVEWCWKQSELMTTRWYFQPYLLVAASHTCSPGETLQKVVELRCTLLAGDDDRVLTKAAVSPRRAGRICRGRSGHAGLPTPVGHQRPGHGHIDWALIGVVQRSAVA